MFVVVVVVAAPVFVAVALGLVVVLTALGWMLVKSPLRQNWDAYERIRNDWFLRRSRDNYTRNDRLL